jgi:carboxyl-terminal processing protease
LQDHDRAVIIGEPSFGKGLVQNVFPLTGNTALALTTAFYYTPSGRSIQKPLPSGHLEIQKQAEEFRTDSGRSVTGGGGIQPDVAIGPEPPTRLRVALDASGIITSFATEFIQKHDVKPRLRSDAALLEEFQVYAGQRNIQPSVANGPGARLGAEPAEAGDFQSGAGRGEGRRGGSATRSGARRSRYRAAVA